MVFLPVGAGSFISQVLRQLLNTLQNLSLFFIRRCASHAAIFFPGLPSIGIVLIALVA